MAKQPLLRTHVTATGIRLELGGWGYGNGRDVAEAADELVSRLRRQAIALRRGGYRPTPEAPRIDLDFLDLLWDLSDMLARGEDIRSRIFRPSQDT